jgi:dinuclear metal center YbgI/SA1388 family protein
MVQVKQIVGALEKLAPPSLQETYDNSGLLTGNLDTKAEKALVALDLTEAVLDEAVAGGYGMIITHHPFIFSGLKRVTGKSETERILIGAIKNDIAIYAIHTNLDNIYQGVNHKIAQKLGLHNIKILKPLEGQLRKLVVFCPAEHAATVREAMFKAGAGHIGNYDKCSFNLEGKGSFRAGEGADPFVGGINEIHFEEEVRVETILPTYAAREVIRAMVEAHPYEEVAYDLYPLENIHDRAGAGMVGDLSEPSGEKEFMENVKDIFKIPVIRHSKLLAKPISKVAFCGGSGSFLISNARAAGADVFLTGDVKYHQFFEADEKLVIADIGHFESEQFTPELIVDYLKQKFPNFATRISDVMTNAVKYF